jgi:hypothetical protein
VQVQIDRIDRELQIQMTRTAQIQAEIDQLRANLKRLAIQTDPLRRKPLPDAVPTAEIGGALQCAHG